MSSHHRCYTRQQCILDVFTPQVLYSKALHSQCLHTTGAMLSSIAFSMSSHHRCYSLQHCILEIFTPQVLQSPALHSRWLHTTGVTLSSNAFSVSSHHTCYTLQQCILDIFTPQVTHSPVMHSWCLHTTGVTLPTMHCPADFVTSHFSYFTKLATGCRSQVHTAPITSFLKNVSKES